MKTFTIKSDGGARGNPGPAAIGFVVYLSDLLIYQHKEYIGEATNNIAEYKAIIKALWWVQKNYKTFSKDDPIQVSCLLDSNLVVNQLNGNYKIKQPHLQELANQAFQIIQSSPFSISFNHIRREKNTQADALLNQALDSQT